MAGALPSGDDPEEFDLGDYGIDGAGLSDLARRTQDNIEASLKSQMKAGGWKQMASILFQTLDPSLPYTTAILKAIAEALLGSVIGADTIDQIFDVIQAWSDGLEQAWEDFWSAFGIDINVVQNDLNTIFAVLGDIANPEAWDAAWNAFLDILTQFGLTADSEHHPFDLTKLVTDLTKDLLKPLGLILGPDSPLNAANLFGQFAAPLAWLINRPPELLWNPGFSSSISLDGGDGWEWAPGVYRTVSTDREAGSAKVTCSGTDLGLRSNTFSVSEGQGLDISVEVLWAALSAAGKPIRVTLEGKGTAGATSFLVGEVGVSDGADPLGWTGAPTGSKSATISNTWVVPAGIDTVYMRLGVTSAATAGTVHFDAASVLLEASGIPTEWLSELVDAFAQVVSPFQDLNSLFDPAKWSAAWEGVLTILGLEQSDNQIIANRDSIWTKLFQTAIPAGKLNLHPDMTAVNDELAIIFNPFDNNSLDRAEAWDDLMGLFGLESHTADSVAWWNSLFAENKVALALQSGVTDLADSTRRNINYLLGQFRLGYLNTSWQWVSGTPGTGDLPTGSGFNSLGVAPDSWIADILRQWGIPVGNDLPSQLDPSIPPAPTMFWPVAWSSETSATVPQSTNLYYVVTAVVGSKESAPSNEGLVYISPSWLVPKAQVNLSWSSVPGATFNVYRRTSPTAQYRQIKSGVTGTSTVDRDPSTVTNTQPGSAAASAANAINGAFAATNGNHQDLLNAVAIGAQGDLDGDADTAGVEGAVAGLRDTIAGISGQLESLTGSTETPAGGVAFTGGQAGWQAGGGTNWTINGTGVPTLTSNLAYSWSKTGAGKYVHGIYKTKTLASAQQSVTLVFNTAAPFTNGLNSGSNLLICRAKSDGSSFPFLQVWQSKAQFGYWNGTTRTLVGSAFNVSASAGSSVTFRQADSGTPYRFEAVQNGAVLGAWTFTSTQAPYGSQYLSVGMGMVSGTGVFSDELAPATIAQFSARDMDVPPGLIRGGIGGIMRRTLTTGYSIGGSYNTTVPPSFYDELSAISPGLTRMTGGATDAAGFTVSEEGLYLAQGGFYCSTSGTPNYGVGFYSGVIGARILYYEPSRLPTQWPNGSAIIWASAGHSISPAFYNANTSTVSITGNSTGSYSWFSLAKVG